MKKPRNRSQRAPRTMNSSRDTRAAGKGAGNGNAPSARDWTAVFLAAAMALIVAFTLITSESASSTGSHVVLIMGWVLLGAIWLGHDSLRRTPLRWGLAEVVVLLFLLAHSASALVMQYPGHARPTLNAMWLWISFGLLFLTLRHLARSAVAQRAVASGLIALAVGLAVFGYYQSAYALPALRAEYAENPAATLLAAGIQAPPGSPARQQFEDRLASTEPFGPFALTNSLAGFLTPWIVLLVAVMAQTLGRAASRRWRVTVGAILALAALAGCLLLTKSRSAYLATGAGFVLLLAARAIPRRWLNWRSVIAGTLGLILAGLAAAVLGGLDRQVLTEAPKSLRYRLEYWESTLAMIADHPWWGCGPGNFQQYYTRYKLPQASETVSDPHDFLLEVAATSGLPAAGLFVAAGGVILGRVNRRVHRLGAEQTSTDPSSRTTPGRDPVGGGSEVPRSAVYGGLLLGLVVAFPAGWSGGQPPDLALLWTALPACALLVWCLDPWVVSGQLGPWPLLAALAALLINLSAAGGIGLPGLGQLVWILAALALNAVEPAASAGRKLAATGKRRASVAVVGWVTVLALAIFCYFSMYRPVLTAKRMLGEAAECHEVLAARELCRRAAAADPRWSEPCENGAELAFRQYLQRPRAETVHDFEFAAHEARTRNPQSSLLARRCGDWWLRMAQASADVRLIRSACVAYRQAILLYPNSNLLHAQLAWAYHLQGNREPAIREADEALRLDELTPHRELKLAHRRLEGVEGRISGHTAKRAAPRTTWNAEQLMRNLRKSNNHQ